MPAKRRKKKARPNRYKKALENLLEYTVGNRGSREGNPYMKPEVKTAARLLKKWE